MGEGRGAGSDVASSEVAVIGVWWFATSAVLSTYANTAFLDALASPFWLTYVRFAGSAALGHVANAADSSKAQLRTVDGGELTRAFIVPALLLLGANYSNGVALKLAGITLTYVVKSAIPVATVVVNKLEGVTFAPMVYATLVPTVVGVMLAAWSDLDFSLTGFVAALASMSLQTMLNIKSKAAISATNVSGVKAQLVMASIATVVLSPFALWDLSALLISADGAPVALIEQGVEKGALTLSVVAAVAYHSEYVSNFLFAARVSPLAFSVADICRRLCIIAVGSVLFNKPLTMLNKLGIVVCFAGVLWYTTMDKTPVATAPKDKPSTPRLAGTPSGGKTRGSTSSRSSRRR
ncbi:Phosphoenolpyruvate/phosphate translocator 1, chloroplastic [Hondaea fermentalgiana]|uniref:Phosphoenolpyruvate/phosphate translocator 1, chloroplastic n=1 Tax=Hondaea fermentalgiana TaxID=2315210 RepID=A0A2R5GMP1_9STRA|nr:Phosphoenolpyruvate/phosphate translocator 1, chloroplastic [Hondaea fermentalgiana]|eukprot:GBG31569.1 Phosphoenolpyruvate/phosphate translocator 1, chloroplastic [Hondaea fermentalgiana]